MRQQPQVDKGLLSIEASRSHSGTPHSVGLLRTSDLSDNTQHSQHTNINAPAGFEPAIPASQPPQTYALDRTAAGIGFCQDYNSDNNNNNNNNNYVEAKGSTSDPDSNIIYGSNSKVTITKSSKT